jgi:hypothetical protein
MKPVVYSDPITLEEPIERGEQKIDSIRLRKPRSGELRGLTMRDLLQMDVDTVHELLPRISEPAITKAEAQNLEPADLTSIAQELAGFFTPRGLRDSPTQ